VGWVTFAVQSQRAGIATILPFLVIGGILLLFVKEPRTAENKETIAT
jgi:MFS-type transporter involved in bile tolerance (Atg22 family)